MNAADDRAQQKVGVVGGGSIGVAWAIVFARAGLEVVVLETDAERRPKVSSDVMDRLEELGNHGLLNEQPSSIANRVKVSADIDDVVEKSRHIQECVPEFLPLKRATFSVLDERADKATTLASSSSSMTISEIAEDIPGRFRCLVVHPANPPYLLKVVEVAPARFTDPSTLESVVRLMSSVGMISVTIQKEIEGLVFNRLQGAILREAYCLVRDGVVTPGDLDLVVTEGLGRRWSIVGPFATAELNTRGGIRAHAQLLGPAYARMGSERGQDDPWTPQMLEQVAEDLASRYPSGEWAENVLRRDRELMKQESRGELSASSTIPIESSRQEYRRQPLE